MFFRGQIIGKYKILSTIGSGGFGTVYLAEDTWIDKKVALKVPHKQSVDFGELLREPRLLASLNHPNIVTILTAEKQENVFFIVMEFVPGETLEAIIARDGALDLGGRSTTRARSATPSITRIARACCIAICGRRTCSSPTAACSRSPTSAPRAFSRSPRTARRSSAARRTWRPSSFAGKAVFASDIYSLGVTMYQMLTGVLPYDTPSPADLDRLMRGELLTRAAAEESRRSRRRSTTSCSRRWRREIHARYQRAGELLDDVLAARKCRRDDRRLAARRLRLPRAAPRRMTARTFTAASRRAKRRSRASAGTAASRSTPARIAARSAAKRSSESHVRAIDAELCVNPRER